MRSVYLCLILCWLCACERTAEDTQVSSAEAASKPSAYSDYLTALAEGHLTPAYAALANAAASLNVSLADMCEQPITAEKIAAAQSQWTRLMHQWQVLQWFQLGPIQGDNRHARLQYWPDVNDAVERGTVRLLRAAELPTLAQLANTNVGAQGMPALERLLFEWIADEGNAQRHICSVAGLIAENVHNISQQVDAEWQQFAAVFVTGSDEFAGPKDAVEETISNWLAQLILILDNKISYPLSIKSPGIPQLAESFQADTSTQNLQQNLRTFEVIFTGAYQIGLDDILLKSGQASLADSILSQLKIVQLQANALPASMTEALASDEGRAKLQELTQALRKLQSLLAVDMVAALELNLGFNALDGD